jgi:hypothetical protein
MRRLWLLALAAFTAGKTRFTANLYLQARNPNADTAKTLLVFSFDV